MNWDDTLHGIGCQTGWRRRLDPIGRWRRGNAKGGRISEFAGRERSEPDGRYAHRRRRWRKRRQQRHSQMIGFGRNVRLRSGRIDDQDRNRVNWSNRSSLNRNRCRRCAERCNWYNWCNWCYWSRWCNWWSCRWIERSNRSQQSSGVGWCHRQRLRMRWTLRAGSFFRSCASGDHVDFSILLRLVCCNWRNWCIQWSWWKLHLFRDRSIDRFLGIFYIFRRNRHRFGWIRSIELIRWFLGIRIAWIGDGLGRWSSRWRQFEIHGVRFDGSDWCGCAAFFRLDLHADLRHFADGADFDPQSGNNHFLAGLYSLIVISYKNSSSFYQFNSI